jgi:PHP family Zn ribbon phosphoesterase
MSIYHTFCEICKHILTLGEMQKYQTRCDECIEEQTKALEDKKEEANGE